MKTLLILLSTFALLQTSEPDWIQIDYYDYKSAVKFSPIPDDEAVTLTFTVFILEESLPQSIESIDSFRTEITLESGFTITKVLKDWELVKVESPDGVETMDAISLKIVLDEWENWELNIFRVLVWLKLKNI